MSRTNAEYAAYYGVASFDPGEVDATIDRENDRGTFDSVEGTLQYVEGLRMKNAARRALLACAGSPEAFVKGMRWALDEALHMLACAENDGAPPEDVLEFVAQNAVDAEEIIRRVEAGETNPFAQ